VISSFFTNFSPFLIFILGGYLAINGRLELGALVAFLSAQEKVFDPWRELIDFYQSYQEASVSYSRTMEFFDESPEFAIEPVDRKPYQLTGNIEVNDLSFTTEEGIRLLNKINLSVSPGEQLALVGFSGSGKSTLALCIGQLFRYTEGHLKIDNQESFSEKKLSGNSYFLDFLDEADLKLPLLDLAARLCVQTISILGNLPPDELF
jgi:ABC-type bacteriocin/lantibiotic exporter with double-glycine peptidase domain